MPLNRVLDERPVNKNGLFQPCMYLLDHILGCLTDGVNLTFMISYLSDERLLLLDEILHPNEITTAVC